MFNRLITASYKCHIQARILSKENHRCINVAQLSSTITQVKHSEEPTTESLQAKIKLKKFKTNQPDSVQFTSLKKEFKTASKNGGVSDECAVSLLHKSGNRCVGASPTVKVALADDIFKSVDKRTLRVYKALVSSYNENKHQFDRNELVSKMKSDGVLADTSLNMDFFWAHCSQGDMAQAQDLLKTWIPPKFNQALIIGNIGYGHCMNNNLEQAFITFDKLIELDNFWEGYIRLLEGFASKSRPHLQKGLNSLRNRKITYPLKENEFLALVRILQDANYIEGVKAVMPFVKDVRNGKFVERLVTAGVDNQVMMQIYKQFYQNKPVNVAVDDFYRPILASLPSKSILNTSRFIIDYTGSHHQFAIQKLTFREILLKNPSKSVEFLKSLKAPEQEKNLDQFQLFDKSLIHVLSHGVNDGRDHLKTIKAALQQDDQQQNSVFFNRFAEIVILKINDGSLKPATISSLSNKLEQVFEVNENVGQDKVNTLAEQTRLSLARREYGDVQKSVHEAVKKFSKHDLNIYLEQVFIDTDFSDDGDGSLKQLLLNVVYTNRNTISHAVVNALYLNCMEEESARTKLVNNVLPDSFAQSYPVTFLPAKYLDPETKDSTDQQFKQNADSRLSLATDPSSRKWKLYVSYIKSGLYREASALSKGVTERPLTKQQPFTMAEFLESGLTPNEVQALLADFSEKENFSPSFACQTCIKSLLSSGNHTELEKFLDFMASKGIELTNRSKVDLLKALCNHELSVPHTLINQRMREIVGRIQKGQLDDVSTLTRQMENLVVPPVVLCELLCKIKPADYEHVKAKLKELFPWFKPELQSSVLLSRIDALLKCGDVDGAVDFVNTSFQYTEGSFVWNSTVQTMVPLCHKTNKMASLKKIARTNMPPSTSNLLDALTTYYEIKDADLKAVDLSSEQLFNDVVRCVHQKADHSMSRLVYDFTLKSGNKKFLKTFLIVTCTTSADSDLCKEFITQSQLPMKTIRSIFTRSIQYSPTFEVLCRCVDLSKSFCGDVETQTRIVHDFMTNSLRFCNDFHSDDIVLENVTQRFRSIPRHHYSAKTLRLYSKLQHHLVFGKFSRSIRTSLLNSQGR